MLTDSTTYIIHICLLEDEKLRHTSLLIAFQNICHWYKHAIYSHCYK